MAPESNIGEYTDGPVLVAGACELHPYSIPGIDGIKFYEPTVRLGSRWPEVFSVRLEGYTFENAKIYRVRPANLGTVGGDFLSDENGFNLRLRVEKNGVSCFPSHDGQPNFKGELISITTDREKRFISVGRRGQIDLPGGVVLIPVMASDESYVNGIIIVGKNFFKKRETQEFLNEGLKHGIEKRQLYG